MIINTTNDMDKKIIITVGRQIGSGGHDVARMLAEMFGCRFYDRELLNLAAKESGFSETFFEQNDEHKGFFKSIFQMHGSFIDGAFYRNEFSQESLFKFQSDAIVRAASESSCVFVGRCADYILRDIPGKVDVFITADIDDRIARVVERKGCSREQAAKMIANGESDRASYYNYYTRKRWGHSDSYDLCVNSSILGIEGTAKFIEEFIKLKVEG